MMNLKYFQTHLLNKNVQGARGNYNIKNIFAAGPREMFMTGFMDNGKKVAVKYQSFISEHETSLCFKFLDNNFSNVINILDIFKNHSHPGFFIIMDFTDMPFTQYTKDKKDFADTKSQQFQSMIKQICYGLYELHEIEIIYLNFSPYSIVVRLDNNTTKYMLCPLGLDRSLIENPMFMAPELLNEDQYSVKVDIWALGCILYSLLANKNLFEGNNQEIVQQISKITQQEIDFKINSIQQIDYQIKQLLIQMIQINQRDRLTIIQVIQQINNYYENINKQQTAMQIGQTQYDNLFMDKQIVKNQKPRLNTQQQLRKEIERIDKIIEIQCNQMKDNFQNKLNESKEKLLKQFYQIGQSYSSQDAQQIINQTIQDVQIQSYDIIDNLFKVKLESDKRLIMEQKGQKELTNIDHQAELNQKQMEIDQNLEKINNLQEQIQTYIQEKQRIMTDFENNKQIISALLEQNLKLLNQLEYQNNSQNKQYQQYERNIAQLEEKLQQAQENLYQAQQLYKDELKNYNSIEIKLKLAEQKIENAKYIQQQDDKFKNTDSMNTNQVLLGYLQKLTDYFNQQENSSQNIKQTEIQQPKEIFNQLDHFSNQQQFQPYTNENSKLQKPNFSNNINNRVFFTNQISLNKSFQSVLSPQANTYQQQSQSQSNQSIIPNQQNQDQE